MLVINWVYNHPSSLLTQKSSHQGRSS